MKLANKTLAILTIVLFLLSGLPALPVQAVGTHIVTTTNDSGAGSLRQAIIDTTAGDTITFSSTLSGSTILLYDNLVLNKHLVIDGSDLSAHVRISGEGRTVFIIPAGVEAYIKHLDIINGAAGDGGGIYNVGDLTVSNCTFSNNHSGSQGNGGGGAIYNVGTLAVENSTFDGNTAAWYGGAIHSEGTATVSNSTFIDNKANFMIGLGGGNGGGIYNAGWMTVKNSTFSGNSADINGGGIYNGIYAESKGLLSIENSTFSGNGAVYYGGGVYNDFILAVTNSTFSANRASYGGGLYNSVDGDFQLANSILANSTLANSTSTYDCLNYGDIVDSANNLIEANGSTGSSCGDDSIIADPKLGLLSNNGGATLTHALLAGSPAIDHGDNVTCAGPPINNFDQRGQPRPVDGDKNGSVICDIGAFEFQGTPGSASLLSQGKYDGWVLESSETSKKGGSLNSRSKVFNVGDDDLNRQYRGILSFDTSSLPDWAVITKVTLKVKTAGLVGTNPFKSHKGLRVDIRNPYFGTKAGLQTSDFQTKGSKNLAGKFSSKAVSKWYSADLSAASSYVNKTGLTQFRLRFYRDDNNDGGADYFKFYSGNAPIASRPQLVVEYYVP